MRLLLHTLLAVAAALALGGARPARAQEEAGGYTTRVSAQTFGTETYRVSRNADGTRRAEAEAAFGQTKLKIVTVFGADHAPTSFEMEVNGAKTLTQQFTAAGVKVMAAGQPEKTVNARPDAVLENGLWHHFVFLFARYDARRGGAQTFAAFLPSQALPFKVTIEPAGRADFEVKGRKVTTERFRAQTDLGLSFEVWTDEARATPLLFSLPAQSLQAVRHGAEDLAAVVFAPPPGPAESDPYATEEVAFQNGGQKLAGTLTLPKGAAGPHPAAVLITGSGGQDRDGTGVSLIYRRIAERLSANGVAVLRADDRGVGRSTPLASQASSYRDLVADTRAAFEYLLTRGDIDKNRVALVGHSEGSETALIIAAEDARVAAVALLAGTSEPVDRVVVEQSIYQAAMAGPIDPSDRTKYSAIAQQLMGMFEKAKAAPKPAAGAADPLAWFREHAEHDPLATARKVRVPAFVAGGERDALVMPHHALALASAMAEAGNRRVTLRVFRDLTHQFTPASGGERAGEVSETFLRALQEWAAGALAKGK